MDSFDPYHTWLGIPARHQPPDHYRLLGLEQFEDHLEAIRDAAERQMAHVRRYQLGAHAQWSQRILNELARASATLTHPQSKLRYDQELRQKFNAPPAAPPVVMAVPVPTAPVVPTAPRAAPPVELLIRDQPADRWARRHGRRPGVGLVLAAAAATLVVVAGLIYSLVFWPSDGTPPIGPGSKSEPIAAKAGSSTDPDEPTSAPAAAATTSRPSRLTDSVGQELVLIQAGSFLMGSAEDDPSADADSRPRHRVEISRPFYLGVHEVTQQQYQAVMDGYNPSVERAAHQPVTQVNWSDAEEFCRRLSLREQALYRLPTEAEWEYACRAGTSDPWYTGRDEADLRQAGWYQVNSQGGPRLVGQLGPNAWGLYDMHGNVAEMVQDWFDAKYYDRSPEADPAQLQGSGSRVYRGGNFSTSARECRSAYRGAHTSSVRSAKVGFRVVRVAGE